MGYRAVIAARISVKTDDSTSIERQLEATRARVALDGGEVVGEAIDAGVSANKVMLPDRAGVGPWLLDRIDEFDTLVFWRMDRAARKPHDLNWLRLWAEENKKRVLLVEPAFGTLEAIDYRSKKQGGKKHPLQDFFIGVLSWFISQETDTLSERVLSSQNYLRRRGEWTGGTAPYGFVPVRIPDKPRGWVLAPCKEPITVERFREGSDEKEIHTLPATIPILNRIINELFMGKKLGAICNELNAEGVLAPRAWWAMYKGRDVEKEMKWSHPTVKKMLQNRVLVGESWHAAAIEDDEDNVVPYKDRPKQRVVDNDGNPVQRSEAVLSMEKFKKLQELLEENSMERIQRYEKPNPFLGVARCARCGEDMYYSEQITKGYLYRNFQCKSKSKKYLVNCRQPMIAADYVEHVIKEITLSFIGTEEVKTRRFVQGDDKSEEKAQIEERLRELEEESDAGLILDRTRYLERKRKLIDRVREIGENPVREARFEWTGAGKTYAEMWDDINLLERLKLIDGLGIRIYIGRGESPAADKAWDCQDDVLPELPVTTRLSASFSEAEINNLLTDIGPGGQIKKDFRVWLLQSSKAFPSEILDQLSPAVKEDRRGQARRTAVKN